MIHGSHTIGVQSPPRLVNLRAYDSAGVGHVMPASRYETRHPCGEQVRAERFRHPALVPCPACVGGPVERPAGWTEGELSEAWGK